MASAFSLSVPGAVLLARDRQRSAICPRPRVPTTLSSEKSAHRLAPSWKWVKKLRAWDSRACLVVGGSGRRWAEVV